MLKIEIEFLGASVRQTVLFEPGLCVDWRREIERRLVSSLYIVVVDAEFARLHGLPPSGSTQGKWRYLWAAAGEERKNLEQYADLADAALDFDPDPDTVLVGFGGGTVCDMAGFLAATLFRGMRLVLIPTTLLAQADTAIGGKNGLNTRRGKNILGTVRMPCLTMIDVNLLETLPPAEYRRGLSEVVKAAVLDGTDFFDELRSSAHLLAAGNQGFVSGVIARCCRFKAGLIMADPKDEGRRRTLNVGHVFGHVLETLAGFDGRVRHGDAVGVGLALACDFSAGRGVMSVREAEEVKELLTAIRVPVKISALGARAVQPPNWEGLLSGGAAVSALLCGNRTVNGRIGLVLPAAIGDCRLVEGVAPEEVVNFLRQACTY